MIIDAHVHYAPPELAAGLADFARAEPFWGLLMGGPSSAQGWATAERMIADMDAAGVDQVVLVGEYRQQHAGCVARNDAGLALARRYPGRVVPFAIVQPRAGQAALDELARCVDAGMRGVGELGPYGQGYRLDDPDFLRVVEACIRYDIPLNLHVNEEVGRYYAGKAIIPLAHVYRLAERYPELKLIAAHWGGGLLFYELSPAAARVLRNVSYDTAGSPLLYGTSRIFPIALSCVGAGKLVYGSDYPLRLYPRAQAEPDMRPFLAEIAGLALSDDNRADMMGRNMARLLSGAAQAGAQVEHADIGRRRPAEWDRPAVQAEDAHSRLAPSQPADITPRMSVAAVALAFPSTQAVFDKHGIPWQDQPVPYWEPIVQAAAVRGIGGEALQRLIAELNEALS